MPKLTLVNPLKGVATPLNQETHIVLGRVGFLIGYLLKAEVKTGAQALLALQHIRNVGAASDMHTATVADALATGLLEWEQQFLPTPSAGQRKTAKKKPVPLAGGKLKKSRGA